MLKLNSFLGGFGPKLGNGYNFVSISKNLSSIVYVDRSGCRSNFRMTDIHGFKEDIKKEDIDSILVNEKEFPNSHYYNEIKDSVALLEKKRGEYNKIDSYFDKDVIYIKEQNEVGTDRPKNIEHFLLPLCLTTNWNLKSLGIFGDIWKIVMQNGSFDDPEFVKDMLLVPNTSLISYCKYDYLEKIYHKWLVETRKPFGLVLGVLNSMYRCNITDGSVCNEILYYEREYKIKEVVGAQLGVFYNYTFLLNELEIQKKIRQMGIKRYVESTYPLNFQKIIPDHKAWWLISTHYAIKQIPKVEGVFNNSNIDQFLENPISEQLRFHPKVVECGHTNESFRWTLKTLQYLYNMGWNFWAIEYLRGNFD